VIFGVSDEKERRLRRPVVRLDDVIRGGRSVVDLLAADAHAAMGDRTLLFQRRQGTLLSALSGRRGGCWRGLLLRRPPATIAALWRVCLRLRQAQGEQHGCR